MRLSLYNLELLPLQSERNLWNLERWVIWFTRPSTRPFHPFIVRRPDFCGVQPDNLVHGGYVRIRVHADRVLSIYRIWYTTLHHGLWWTWIRLFKTDNSASDSWNPSPHFETLWTPYTKWMEVNWAMVNLIRIRFSSGHMIFLPLKNSGHCHIEYHFRGRFFSF